ncbi:MAG TPA: stage V sporulation protein D [Bacillota bacterium]|nr:stage V sporulation protein D [Bacillota bacterium]HPL53490.1 stage V sporulation protein D [Bacillota bacterium]
MSGIKVIIKRRIVFIFFAFFVIYVGLLGRLTFIQIINSTEYQQKALEQWTRDIPIKSKRGIIYDRNLKKLAVSATAYEVYVRPAMIKDKEAVITALSEVLGIDKDTVAQKMTAKKDTVLIKKKVDNDKVKLLREKELAGIVFNDDSMRFYPQSNFASYILGFTNPDNQGQDGVELTYEKYLNGFPGRNIVMTDAHGQMLPGSDTKYYEPQDGLDLVLAVDEVIQHFAEKAALNALIENKAKRVTAIVMEPRTGDILAMAVKPDFDNNDPRKIPEELKDKWDSLSDKDQLEALFKIWRNPAISDSYEPGSTFKVVTSSAGLEENVVKPDDHFNCIGHIIVAGKKIKCWRSYNPHGNQTFVEAVKNSCNPVFVEVGQRLGKEKFYKYIKAFGFGTPTNVRLPGEAGGIVRSLSGIGPVELANNAFGQGISVTPIQLITAVSAIANDGYLMEPRIAKKVIDNEGKTIHEFQSRIVRQVISKETAATMRQILEYAVAPTASSYIPGYKVAGKTGTAQKAEGGIYVSGKFVSSFCGFAPANDPKISVLVVIDEPGGAQHFGGVIAAPVAKSIIYDSLRYLDVKPQYTEEEQKLMQKPLVKVPEVRNIALKDAIKELAKYKLKYSVDTEYEHNMESKILDQTPKPGADINEGSIVILYAKPIE